MAEPIRLAIVGCGGMGHRHMMGLVELHRQGLTDLRLAAACDPVTDNARSLARQAERHFGHAPAVVADLAELPALGVQAIDLTSPPALHHTLIEQALDAGLHVMTEKPVGLTVASALRICRAAEAHPELVVSVAENYRRDPINRLARALLEAGVIGDRRLMLMNSVGGQDGMLITLWRHTKKLGGILVDMGVHYGDILEFFMGPAVTVYGQKRLHETVRRNRQAAAGDGGDLGNPAGAYSQWQAQMPASFEPDAEDALYGTVVFANGATAQFTEDHAGWGRGHWERVVYGSRGSMDLPPDRSGDPLVVHIGTETVTGQDVLGLLPDFALDEVTARLFGGERLWRYGMEFAQVDAKFTAMEYAELAGAIRGECAVEVDAWQGTRALALIYALLESAAVGRAVSMEEILRDDVTAYQAEINADMGL